MNDLDPISRDGALRHRDLAWAYANSCAASGLAELDPPHASQSMMVILEGGALRRRDRNGKWLSAVWLAVSRSSTNLLGAVCKWFSASESAQRTF